MTLPKVVSQEEWTAARRILLEKEKDFTRQRDRLNTERRELPMVEVTKPYEFEGRWPINAISLRFALDDEANKARWARWALEQTSTWSSPTDAAGWDWARALA